MDLMIKDMDGDCARKMCMKSVKSQMTAVRLAITPECREVSALARNETRPCS